MLHSKLLTRQEAKPWREDRLFKFSSFDSVFIAAGIFDRHGELFGRITSMITRLVAEKTCRWSKQVLIRFSKLRRG